MCQVCRFSKFPPLFGFIKKERPLFQHVFYQLVRVGLNFPLNGNRAYVCAHVVVVRGHDWRTFCSVFATGARVAQSFVVF